MALQILGRAAWGFSTSRSGFLHELLFTQLWLDAQVRLIGRSGPFA